jgi:hypothetical protein
MNRFSRFYSGKSLELFWKSLCNLPDSLKNGNFVENEESSNFLLGLFFWSLIRRIFWGCFPKNSAKFLACPPLSCYISSSSPPRGLSLCESENKTCLKQSAIVEKIRGF